MKIHVRLYVNLKAYAPGKETGFHVDLDPGATVKDLMGALKIPDTVKRVVVVNGRRARDNSILQPDDAVTLFPPLEGG
jgi:molybdopterin converting factor small subunit